MKFYKMRKILFIVLIGLAVVSCQKEDDSTPPPVAASIEGNWTTINQEQIINISFSFDPNNPPLFELDTNIFVDPMWPLAIDIGSDSIIFYDIDTSQAKYLKSENMISVYNYDNIYNIDTLDFIIDNLTNDSLTLFAMLDLNILNTDSLLGVYFDEQTASSISMYVNSDNIDDYASIQMKWNFIK